MERKQGQNSSVGEKKNREGSNWKAKSEEMLKLRRNAKAANQQAGGFEYVVKEEMGFEEGAARLCSLLMGNSQNKAKNLIKASLVFCASFFTFWHIKLDLFFVKDKVKVVFLFCTGNIRV